MKKSNKCDRRFRPGLLSVGRLYRNASPSRIYIHIYIYIYVWCFLPSHVYSIDSCISNPSTNARLQDIFNGLMAEAVAAGPMVIDDDEEACRLQVCSYIHI